MATARKWDFVREEKFQNALVEAFPSRTELEQLIRYGLGEDLDAITSETNLQSAVFAVLKWVRVRGKLDRLFEEARRRNPDNPMLRAFAEPQVPFLVPFGRDPGFVGRGADLDELHRLLKNSPTGVRRVALVGMGGVGKTQLAAEYAHRRRSEYPGGVYWVNAAAPLVGELAAIADRLALRGEERLGLREDAAVDSEGPVQRLRALERHLGENPGALVIFDNVADPLVLREPAAGILPWELPCYLLLTTRKRDPDASAEIFPVGGLPEEAALHLLLSSKARQHLPEDGRTDELHAAKSICAALGHLPLAIVLAAAYLGKSPGLALSDYLLRLRREGGLTTADAAKVDSLRLRTQHAAAVEATLRTQWDALKTPEARHTLKTAALLRSAAQVSRATLGHLTGLSDEAKNGYPAPLEEALNELAEWSLIEDLTPKAIRLHPLVREFAASRIEDRDAFAAACARRLAEALGDMDRLDAEVRARGLDAVLVDLRLGEELAGAEGRESFRRLLRPLDREAHCLRRWDPAREPGFFLQQVRNVSFDLGIEEVQRRAEAALRARGLTWLCERLRTSRESDALVRTLAGHTSSVWAVTVLPPDGRSALSASHDQSLKVWDISSGCELRTLGVHASPVNGVAVTPDGRLAVSASDDGTLKVWDISSGCELRTIPGHASPVNGVAVTPDGRLAVSASDDGTLKVWDISSGRESRTLAGHDAQVNGVAVTPDGRRILSASDDGTLKVWDISSGRVIHTLEGHAHGVLDVAVTPDGRFAVSASADGTLKVWEIATGQEVRTLAGNDALVRWVNGVAVTPDGRFAISASSDNGTLKVWEIATGRAIHTLEGHAEPVKDVAVTPDGRLAVSASHDKTLKLWELSSGREVRAPEGHTREVPGVTVTPDGRFIVSASWDRTLRVWDLSSCASVRTLEGHASWVMRVVVTPDGRLAVSASEDKTVKVWELSTGREVRTLAGHTWGVTGVAVTPDGLAVSASGDKTVKVWELSTGREVRTLAGHTWGVTGVAATRDGRLVISASEDKTLKVWDLATGREVRTLVGHTLGVTGVAVTPDGRRVVSASEDKTLKVWDLATGRETHTLRGHTEPVKDVVATPDGCLAVSAAEDTTLRVWDLIEGRCIATLEAHAPLLSCAVAPGGRTFLAGDSAGSLHVLDWILPSMEARSPFEPRSFGALDAGAGRPQSHPLTEGRAPEPPLRPVTIHGVSASGAEVSTAPVSAAGDLAGPRRTDDRVKILFLASNPHSTSQLHLTREARRIQERLGVGRPRDVFEFVARWAVRRSELQRLLLEEEPHVLHFSSHGSAGAQILLEDDEGNAAPVTKKALVDLIGILKHRLQLVVLNACDTKPIAQALVRHVACAIGMRQPVGDDAASAFAASFYQALAFHASVEKAFRLACNELRLQQIPEEQTPILTVKRGVDATTLVITAQSHRIQN